MIKLNSVHNKIDVINSDIVKVLKVTKNDLLPVAARSKYALLANESTHDGCGWGLILVRANTSTSIRENIVHLASDLSYLDENDVIKFNPHDCSIRALYRHNANINAFLLTERCNSYCLMCSQPPRPIDDFHHVETMLAALPLIPKNAHEIMISGGEPTLWGSDFIRVIEACKAHLPFTGVHVLSNGRTLKDESFALKVCRVNHHDLMFGIPLYSDIPERHNFIVQADNGFDEAIRGIVNLKKFGGRVEIRIVVHKINYDRLVRLSEFIGRNLKFVDQVVIMGLEITGFTRANLEALWVDPFDYKDQLSQAIKNFELYGIRASIYNHPLCLLNEDVRIYARKSISDWKNDYFDQCKICAKQSDCGGFFSSAKIRHSEHITPFNYSHE